MYITDNEHNDNLIPIYFFNEESLAAWLEHSAEAHAKNWVQASDFKPKTGQHIIVPATDGTIGMVIGGNSENNGWDYGAISKHLPEGKYFFADLFDEHTAFLAALSWGLAGYKFAKYKKHPELKAELQVPVGVDADSLQHHINSIFLIRNLINTPANDLGPDDLGKEVSLVAENFNADFTQIVGDELLTENFPAIHAVGRASDRDPRLLEITWGNRDHFKLAIIGKGVCFDSGGLDIKPAAGMRDMKKDMGGAAHALGLAYMIMAHNLPISLRMLIPAVDNVIAGNAYKPGDIVKTRAGFNVEIGNTDAEGRVVLSDAIALATAAKPDLMIDFATLTGAARVALGPDLPAMFSTNDENARALQDLSWQINDPIWHMPLYKAYKKFNDSKIGDISNCASIGYGGAITAALFLEHFIADHPNWMHFDIMASNTRDLPGRPEGGDAMGLRAVFAYIRQLVD
jgi:leucyl aminopeptidase